MTDPSHRPSRPPHRNPADGDDATSELPTVGPDRPHPYGRADTPWNGVPRATPPADPPPGREAPPWARVERPEPTPPGGVDRRPPPPPWTRPPTPPHGIPAGAGPGRPTPPRGEPGGSGPIRPTPPHGIPTDAARPTPPTEDGPRFGDRPSRGGPTSPHGVRPGGSDRDESFDGFVPPGREGTPPRGFVEPSREVAVRPHGAVEPAAPEPYRRRSQQGVTNPDLAHDPNDPTMPPLTPSRWMTLYSIVVAGVMTAGLVIAGGLELRLIAAIVLVMQIGAVVAYTLLRHTVSRGTSIVVGVAASVAADAIAVYTQPLRSDYLAFVMAGVFFATIVGQLVRRRGRRDLTDGMAAGVYIGVIAVGMSTLIALVRHGGGGQALAIGAVAVGAAVIASRAIDIPMPNPRINRQVPRGAFGIVIGAMVGTAAAAYTGVLLDGITAQKAAVGGIAIALVGVLGDVSAGYAHAGRRIAGEGEAAWPLRHGLGPLLAFGTAAPLLYLLSVFYLVRAY